MYSTFDHCVEPACTVRNVVVQTAHAELLCVYSVYYTICGGITGMCHEVMACAMRLWHVHDIFCYGVDGTC